MNGGETRSFSAVHILPPTPIRFGYYDTGIYDASCQRLDIWPLMISSDSMFPIGKQTLRKKPDSLLSGKFIYSGVYDPRFGHFLTETLPNLLAAMELFRSEGNRKLLFVAPKPSTMGKMFNDPAQEFFLKHLALNKSDICLVQQPVTVKDILVPQTPFLKKFTYSPNIIPKLDALGFSEMHLADRLYLSRTRWPVQRVVDEPEVERQFEDMGYLPIHLQDYSLAEQFGIIRAARHLAGPQGTALHWSLYGRNVKSVISMGWKSTLQKGICKVRSQVYRNPRGVMVSLRQSRLRYIPQRSIRRSISSALADDLATQVQD